MCTRSKRLRVHKPRLLCGGAGLLVRAEEVVVSFVGLKLRLTHGACGCRSSATAGIQPLNEGDLRQKLPAVRPLLVPDRLQAQASDPTGIRTACVSAAVDLSGFCRPHPAGIERALPGRVTAERYR